MKYLTILTLALVMAAGCASSDKADQETQLTVTHQYQDSVIIDEEYDSLIAPQYDYTTYINYEDQIKNTNTSASPAPSAKPAKKPAAKKVQ